MPSRYSASGGVPDFCHPDIEIGEAAHARAMCAGGRGAVRERTQNKLRVGHLLYDGIIDCENEVDRIDDEDVADCENKDEPPDPPHASH